MDFFLFKWAFNVVPYLVIDLVAVQTKLVKIQDWFVIVLTTERYVLESIQQQVKI